MQSVDITEDVAIAKPMDRTQIQHQVQMVFQPYFQACINNLAKPLTMLFQKILESGKFLGLLKEATITPIHKGGNKSEAKNHGSGSLSSHKVKTVEHIFPW